MPRLLTAPALSGSGRAGSVAVVTSSTATSRTSTWVGIAVGVVLLGLLAAFAIGLPKAAGEDEPQAMDLSLPDALPGGFAPADDPASFTGGQFADQAESIAKQEKANTAYGNKVLPDVLGTSAVTRTYVVDGSKAVFVQAFQSSGGAFAPNSIPDPAQTGGAPTTEMKGVGDGVCILSYGQQSTGQSGPAPVFNQCQVTDGGITVQIGASSVPADDLVTAADALLEDLQDQ